MNFIRGLLNFVGRIMLCAVFTASALMQKIPNFDETAEKMQSVGIPQPKVMLIGAIVFLLFGSLLVVSGYAGRLGALLLIVFLGAATYYFHPFWKHAPDSAEFATQIQDFMKNLAIAGALVMVLANGAGPWSLGKRKSKDDEDDDDYDR